MAVNLPIIAYIDFRMKFGREEDPQGDGVNEPVHLGKLGGCTGDGSHILEMSNAEGLISQVKGNEDFDIRLRDMLRKTLGNRLEASSSSPSFSWEMDFVSETRASLKCFVGGGFFDGFLAEYKEPFKLMLELGFRFGEQEFVYGPHEISPSVLIEKQLGEDFRASGFEDERTVEFDKPVAITDEVRGWVQIGLAISRKLTLTNLPSKCEMGRKILENKVESDFQIIADDNSRFDCHKVFLACNSTPLAGMLKMECKESKENSIKLNMSAKGVEALLKFIYYTNVDEPKKSPVIALELLEIGHQYDINGIEEAMKDIFLGQKYDWFDIDTVVLLYLWTLKVDGNEKLKWKALQAFKSNPDALDDSIEYDKLMKESPQTAKGLMALCFKI